MSVDVWFWKKNREDVPSSTSDPSKRFFICVWAPGWEWKGRAALTAVRHLLALLWSFTKPSNISPGICCLQKASYSIIVNDPGLGTSKTTVWCTCEAAETVTLSSDLLDPLSKNAATRIIFHYLLWKTIVLFLLDVTFSLLSKSWVLMWAEKSVVWAALLWSTGDKQLSAGKHSHTTLPPATKAADKLLSRVPLRFIRMNDFDSVLQICL